MVVLFTPPELTALIRDQPEGQFLEFKSVWDRSGPTAKLLPRREVRDTIVKCVAAFANADGGTLLVGVEDDGTATGHGYPTEAVREFEAAAARRLTPTVEVRTATVDVNGSEILVFEVGISPEAVMVDGNGFPYRVSDSVLLEPQEVINARKQAYLRVGWEQRVRPEATIDDLDLHLATRSFASTPLFARPIEEILARYQLVQRRGRGPVGVTNAALVLFGHESISRWHPRAGIRVFRVAGTERTHGAQRNVSQIARLDAPIVELLVEAQQVVRGQIRRSERLHDLFFREMAEYPEFAWQEAIVNAVAHRDYGEQGREIEVWLYDDRMEVSSPGDLVPPVTLERLRSRHPVHASRNPLIVRVLVDIGVMREEGEGIPRIYDEMEASFLHAPTLEVAASTFTLTLRNQPVFEGPSSEWQAIVDRLRLLPAQQRILLAHPEAFTNEDYRQLNDVDRDRAYREIQSMIDAGYVVPPDRTGPRAVYRVSPGLYTARGWLEARVPALRQMLDRSAFLKNADYREAFGLTRFVALRELRRLVEEGFLVAVGERRGSRYLPGPALGSAPEG